MEPRKPYTGRPRARTTRWSVRVSEAFFRGLITVGGIGTIAAVATVFVFLLYVVYPLFQSSEVIEEKNLSAWQEVAPIHLGMDEDQALAWGMFPDGHVEVVQIETGKVIENRQLFAGLKLTAWCFAAGSDEVAFGFEDGSVSSGTLRIASSFVDPNKLPAEANGLAIGHSAVVDKGIMTRTSQGQIRTSKLEAEIKDPAKGNSRSPVILVDQTKTTTGIVIAALNAEGKLRLNTIREQPNLLTGETVYKLSGIELPYEEPKSIGPPSHLFLSQVGDQAYLFWENGTLQRFDARDRAAPKLAEQSDLLKDPRRKVTCVQSLIGKGTLLVGDSSGRVRAWFFAHTGDTKTTDGGTMVCAHEFTDGDSAVTTLAVSDRSRMAAAGFADGSIRLLFVTSDRTMAKLSVPSNSPIAALTLAPKENGLAAVAGGLSHWVIDPKHPEITGNVLFSKIWYEGYPSPQYMWQSSGGTDSFEPKFSLVPLIFGTIKASFYSLLFGVPIALLAAIYTSEFLSRNAKSYVKPAIEMMASLPSVVLGFLAGLVFAQFVENIVPTAIACIITVPLSFLTGAYLWQLLPAKLSARFSSWRFALICLALPIGLVASVPVGSALEYLLFADDLRSWLDGKQGSGIGGWTLVLLPVAGLATVLLLGRFVNPWLRSGPWSLGRFGVAVLDIIKFVLACVFAVGLAAATGTLLQAVGIDPRLSFLGPYSQRNALVVGFVMGFAIIPIIYTIAEDALSSVPEHLRAGSLAAGATQWQTAVRIVIPTAMSGIFSAIMIGLGRAVGETMIVLMATGNTPVMNWSAFSGFRTLSANIAVELPEAVRDSTHYRTLFMAALILFIITFVLNTIAEFVRMRFRKRSYQL